MKIAAFVAALLAIAAIAGLYLTFAAGGDGSSSASALRTSAAPTATAVTPSPTPLPPTWPAGLQPRDNGIVQLLSCLDSNHDGHLDGADGPEFAGLEVTLAPPKACNDPAHHADFFIGAQTAGYACGGAHDPLLIVAIASGGSDLLDASAGESMGVLDIVNALRASAAAAGIGTETLLAASAIFGVDDFPQTHMSLFIEEQVRARLASMPCLRAVLIGHSHGGVTVTSATQGLEATYAARMYGVIIDRTDVIYDRPAPEMPDHTQILNVFQTNEGWHGVPIHRPNVTNVDASREMAPIAPSDGGGPPALVSHKTLDDSPPVQRRIEDAVMVWAAAP